MRRLLAAWTHSWVVLSVASRLLLAALVVTVGDGAFEFMWRGGVVLVGVVTVVSGNCSWIGRKC